MELAKGLFPSLHTMEDASQRFNSFQSREESQPMGFLSERLISFITYNGRRITTF
jgi:hypothetical protein